MIYSLSSLELFNVLLFSYLQQYFITFVLFIVTVLRQRLGLGKCLSAIFLTLHLVVISRGAVHILK